MGGDPRPLAKGETLAADKAAAMRRAMNALQQAQATWLNALRGRIAKLNLEIAAAS